MSIVILVQSDTTVGFLSKDAEKLSMIKERAPEKEYLKVYASFKEMKKEHAHVPKKFKKELRRAKKSSYVLKARSFRVVHTDVHGEFIRPHKWLYSTSANKSQEDFELKWCEAKADIIVRSKDEFSSKSSSRIYRLHQRRKERLR